MKTLIIVDVQHDFMPDGALPVPHGDEVVDFINSNSHKFDLVVATQDWHPRGHGSFVTAHPGKAVGSLVKLGGIDQVVWPVHCVQNTPGAAFHSGLDISNVRHVVRKGSNPGIDSYSGFFDNDHRSATGLEAYLRAQSASQLWVVGLALDYCVKFTALDAARLGFPTTVLVDGCRGVGLTPEDVPAALREMESAGIEVRTGAGLGF